MHIDTFTDKNEKTITYLLNVLNTYHVFKTSDSSFLIWDEWALMLQNSGSDNWVRLTHALIKSYSDDQVFEDFFSLIITYKTYSDYIFAHCNAKWFFQFQDVKSDSFVKNCDWLYSEIKRKHSLGILFF